MMARRRQACARAPRRCRRCCRRPPRAERDTAMRRPPRFTASAVLIALCAVLGGCSSGISSWDPTDLLDFLDTKKKLPGERKPVFPDGVPGLEQGVPKDLYKSNVEQRQQQDAATATAIASQPAAEPKSKNAAKSKGKAKQPAST